MRFKKNIVFLLLVVGVSMLGLNACKSKKQLMAVAAPVEEKVDTELFSDILNNQFIFNTFSSRLSLNLSLGTKSLSSKASIKIVKDKAIQLSVQPLFGIEVLRLYIDRDSLALLDRMNKRYIKESVEDMKKIYPVGFDFKTLQSLLTNRIFVSEQPDVISSDYEKFTTERVSDLHYLLKSVDKKSGIEYGFAVNGNDRIASVQLRQPKENYSLNWQYEDFRLETTKAFPHKMNATLLSTGQKTDVRLEFSGITLNEDFDLEMSVPSGYSRASISDVVKILASN